MKAVEYFKQLLESRLEIWISGQKQEISICALILSLWQAEGESKTCCTCPGESSIHLSATPGTLMWSMPTVAELGGPFNCRMQAEWLYKCIFARPPNPHSSGPIKVKSTLRWQRSKRCKDDGGVDGNGDGYGDGRGNSNGNDGSGSGNGNGSAQKITTVKWRR